MFPARQPLRHVFTTRWCSASLQRILPPPDRICDLEIKMSEVSLHTMRPQGLNVLILEGVNEKAKKILEVAGGNVEIYPSTLEEDVLSRKLKEIDVIGVRNRTRLTKSLLEGSKRLKAIGVFCVGIDQIDLDGISSLGIPIFNSPSANSRSTAELIMAYVLCLARRITDFNRDLQSGHWTKTSIGSHEVHGKTLGIVGYGQIGSQMSLFAASMGMNVQYYDVICRLPLGNAKSVSLEELLSTSDFVTLHVPGTKQTENFMNDEKFSLMPRGSYLINASRGTVVDLAALARNIKSGHLAGAAIDVFPEEPGSNNEFRCPELIGLQNVIITPHIGGSTEESQVAVAQGVSEAISDFFRTGSIQDSVNFPVAVLQPTDKSRVAACYKKGSQTPEVSGIVFCGEGRMVKYLVLDLDQYSDLKECIKTLSESPGCIWVQEVAHSQFRDVT